MALAANQSEQTSSALALESLQAFAHFLSSVRSIASVQRVACSSDGIQLDDWVMMPDEHLEDARRVYDAVYALRQKVGVAPLDVHVVPLSEVDAESLPPSETLFER